MPYNILLLPLIGGFVFIHKWNRTKFKAIRLDKERLLFYASLAGIFLLALAFILETLIPPFIHCVKWFPCLPSLPFPYISVSSLALFLGLTLWYPLNWIWNLDDESSRYIDEEGDPFEQLINRALDSAKPVMLTLKSGKVYVGFVVSSFAPTREQRTIHIVPLKSGYREETKQRVSFTTYYEEVLEKITSDLSRMAGEKHEAETKLQQGKENRIAQDRARTSLAEENQKNKDKLAKLDKDTASLEILQSHLEEVIASLTVEMDTLQDSLNDFGVTIPIEEIMTSTIYSAHVHAEYFPHNDPE